MNGTAEKYWQRSLQMALFCAFVSFVADRELIRTAFGMWEDPTPARLVFFLSSAFVLVGLARNSAQLRKLTEQPVRARAGDPPRSSEKTPPLP